MIVATTDLLVDLLVWTRSTPRLETELLVRERSPAVGRVGLDGEDWVAGWQDAQSVVLWLGVL